MHINASNLSIMRNFLPICPPAQIKEQNFLLYIRFPTINRIKRVPLLVFPPAICRSDKFAISHVTWRQVTQFTSAVGSGHESGARVWYISKNDRFWFELREFLLPRGGISSPSRATGACVPKDNLARLAPWSTTRQINALEQTWKGLHIDDRWNSANKGWVFILF